MKEFSKTFLDEIYSAFPHIKHGLKLGDEKRKLLISIIENHGYEDLLNSAGSVKLFNRLVKYNVAELPRCVVCDSTFLEKYRPGKQYCSFKCYKADPEGWKRISEIKSELYSNQEWKEKTESKKRKTNNERLGVDHPMQSIESRDKHQKNCYQAYDYRGYSSLRGYEKHFVDYMFDELGFDHCSLMSGSDGLKELDLKIKDGNSYRFPDFFVPPFSFVEIKGEYTFEKGLDKTERIKEILDDKGYDYYLVTIVPGKTPKFYSFTLKDYVKDCPFESPGIYLAVSGLN